MCGSVSDDSARFTRPAEPHGMSLSPQTFGKISQVNVQKRPIEFDPNLETIDFRYARPDGAGLPDAGTAVLQHGTHPGFGLSG